MADPSSDPDAHIATTLGALLVGGCVGLISTPPTSASRKVMVLVVWILDLLHSVFIVAALFNYLITFFGDRGRIDHIPWSVALSVVVTAAQTLIVHWYYAHKIWTSSGRNWWITAPIVVLAFGRLLAASVSTSEMIRRPNYSNFNKHFPGWVFTTGLTLSASVDVLITALLCYYLRSMGRRTSSTLINRVVRTMMFYTLENGLITCLAATASLICWLTMPTNLIFMGLHFVIGKLYANSLLVSLNTRQELRNMHFFAGDKESNNTLHASMWPIVGGNSGSAASGSVGVTSPVGGYGAYSTGTTSYAYGVVSTGYGDVNMTTPASAYRPAFKVPVSPPARAHGSSNEIGVRVTRTVRRASDDLSVSDISRDEYPDAAHVGVAGRRNQFGAAVHARRSREREHHQLTSALP
ncbi:hypothetical protein MIND_00194700 [Mycena indigotica]|uniref:DUF6534 domain-containing protein n=1 Tax=Mycena indigotica TaxID=2126181 RepID=A0A8H6T4B9_9AGAR|nr:uncharacterized protein MIND_00194700 [Mycena indigotica]KAF7311840.1 hypothetical protein MIND_00194700 [Mycena indigotica]